MNVDRPTATLGVDLGATTTKTAIVDRRGRCVLKQIYRSALDADPIAVIDALGELLLHEINSARKLGVRVSGIGIGICAPVERFSGKTLLPGWGNINISSLLQDAVRLPVTIDNDANLATLGEAWVGAALGGSIVAGISLGTGIGGGLVLGGDIFRGARGFAAEFGHIAVGDSETLCSCGAGGCVGILASITATIQRYQELAGEQALPIANIDSLIALASQGDKSALCAIETSVRYIGRATLTLINCLDPDVVVFTGGMANLGEKLLEAVKLSFVGKSFRDSASDVRICVASLGLFSGAFGAARLAQIASNRAV